MGMLVIDRGAGGQPGDISARTDRPEADGKLAPTTASPPRAGSGAPARLAPLAATVAFLIALWGIDHVLARVSYGTIWLAILSIPGGQLALAVGSTLLAYAALLGYDALALRYVEHPLGPARTAFSAFVSFSFSNSLGFAMVTGASLRSRLYSAWGLSTGTIGRLVGFIMTTLWVGLLLIVGAALLIEPGSTALLLGVDAAGARALGLVAMLLLAGYFAWCGWSRRPLVIGGWRFSPPRLSLALGQLGVSSVEWLASGLALYALLPAVSRPSFPVFAGLFVIAQGLGLASLVPGGLGVFEGTLLLASRNTIPPAQLAGALLAFRGLYYIAPLLLGTVMLAGHEAVRQRPRVRAVSRAVGLAVPLLTPPAIAIAVFATGVILLLSGATPTVPWRLALLRDFLPLPLLEASHFVASLTGMALLVLAHGLWRRVNAAWGLAAALLGTAVITSLLKGLDYEEALVAAFALGCLLPARHRFHRRSSLLDEQWSPGWVLAIMVALVTSTWLGFFAYRHVDYTQDMWWQFEFSADAPRFLRATVGALSIGLVLALIRLFRPARVVPPAPTDADLERARRLLGRQGWAAANLALLGDKRLLFSESGTAFLMYAVRGRTWVALGDPVGDPSEAAELAWRFRELCDASGGWPVFYEVGRHWLPIYLEQGMSLLKLGEEARVPLDGFTMEGGARASLRRWRNACARAGCEVELLAPGEADPVMPDLQRISDDWLRSKQTREKGFSLGRFTREYVRRLPVAVVRQHGRPVAFATIWSTDTREEVAVDLLRYTADAPPNVMTYLLVHLMEWARTEGYRWFNLGMAPLAGLPARALAPLWSLIGAFVFRHGEHFYHFQGLREFKSRFDPVWEPRYLATPGGFTLPFILTDLAALIGGGLTGVFAK